MAKRVVTTTEYVDDLDGGRAEGTVRFSYDGVAYEIDLSKANTRGLAKELKPYIEAGRRVRSSRQRSGSGRSTKHDLGAIREWATKNGFEVSTRGRIAATVLEAYEATR